MSAKHGGLCAADPRTSLYDYALGLHRVSPDAPLPHGGHPLPGTPRSGPSLGWNRFRRVLAEELTPLLASADPTGAAQKIDARLRALGTLPRQTRLVTPDLRLTDAAAALATARHLARAGTNAESVTLGITLLQRLGGPEDVPTLTILGLLRGFTEAAVNALVSLNCPTDVLTWLGNRLDVRHRRHVIQALTSRHDPTSREWLLAVPLEATGVSPSLARDIAQSVRLDLMLREAEVSPRILAQAARLLNLMSDPYDYRAEILELGEAVTVYDTVVRRCGALEPTLDHYALLLSLALELDSGASVLLRWQPGQREALLEALRSVLTSTPWSAVTRVEPADPVALRRVRWIRRTGLLPFHRPAPADRLQIQVVVRDPAAPGVIETRLLIDGRPLVAEAFGVGPAHEPEYLLDRGMLRAAPEPREVRLATAYCAEPCCGALYVTIRRDGDQVVWRDWRRPSTPAGKQPRPELPELRFDGAAYDAEVERAERDRTWAWPARNTARLLSGALRERPELLTRWDSELSWVATDFGDPDTVVLSFTYRPRPTGETQDADGPWLQFTWTLQDDGRSSEDQAAAALERLTSEDPTSYAELSGGSKAHARALGFPWPEPGRRTG